MSRLNFTAEHVELLLELLQIDTVSPMETGRPSNIWRAQEIFAKFAMEKTGCEKVYHSSVDSNAIKMEEVPLSVRERAHQMGDEFWKCQPNLVLRFGRKRTIEETLMFNFHMDTVDSLFPISFDGDKFVGRGAVDMKGPGVAVLAGIQAALIENPSLLDDVSIILQCVSGEEGGAMGVYGTKFLIEQGWIGRLNIFAEPSAGVYFDRSSTSMTARIEVNGQDSTDDEPHQGHNATLLLGYLAQKLMKELPARIEADGGKMCLAGLYTGNMHNKVFGSGQLLINFSYTTIESGGLIREWVEETFNNALQSFKEEFSNVKAAALTAKMADEICRLIWVKQGLPVLMNRDAEMEEFLNRLGLVRNPDNQKSKAFTCDAMWAQHPNAYTIVYGPGSLGENLAHAEGEYITRNELEEYAGSICKLVKAYGNSLCNKRMKGMYL